MSDISSVPRGWQTRDRKGFVSSNQGKWFREIMVQIKGMPWSPWGYCHFHYPILTVTRSFDGNHHRRYEYFCHSILQSLGGVQFSIVFSHFAQYVFPCISKPWLMYTLNEKEDIFQYSQTQALGAWGEGTYSSSRVIGSKRGPLVSEFVSY